MEQRIGFGKRLGALLLDSVLVCVLSVVGGSTIGAMLGGLAGGALAGTAAMGDQQVQGAAALGGMFGAIAGIFLAIVVIGAVYFLLEGFTGYTLGKLILGIRIANDDGTAAGVPKLLARYALKNINLLLSLLGLLSGAHALISLGRLGGLIIFVGCFFTLGVKRQAFHDMIAHTAVFPKGAIK